MFEAYRVRRSFQWRGWQYAPPGACNCACDCAHQIGSGCKCRQNHCDCDCGIPREFYAGDIVLVEDGHPRKEMMLAQRFFVGDASIPPVEELLKKSEFSRLIVPPGAAVVEIVKERELAAVSGKRHYERRK